MDRSCPTGSTRQWNVPARALDLGHEPLLSAFTEVLDDGGLHTELDQVKRHKPDDILGEQVTSVTERDGQD